MDKNDGIIPLKDENGRLVEMRVVEMLEHLGIKYVLMQNTDERDENSYIFRFLEDDYDQDYDRLENILDQDELEEVADLFDEKISGSGLLN